MQDVLKVGLQTVFLRVLKENLLPLLVFGIAGKAGKQEGTPLRKNVLRAEINAVADIVRVGIDFDAVKDIGGKQDQAVRR